MLPQIPLGIVLRESASFDAFVAHGNERTLNELKGCAAGSGERYLFLWGADGTGKSHLLQACCRAAQEASAVVAYVPLSEVHVFSPEILAELGVLDLVCLDDIDLVCGQPGWELALFNLFNQLRERGSSLVVSADRPPAALPVALADLGSRLGWGLCCQLSGLDDSGRTLLLTESARRRGLELPGETARYILHHAPRDTRALMKLMDRLDLASLAAQRKLTIPFVSRVLSQDPR